MAAPSSPAAIRDVNVRYHDAAADHYDAKWGISWDDVGRDQVLGKVRKLVGPGASHFARSLEIGAGTGYFSLHLLRAGIVGEATCTDISPRMLGALRANAAELGVQVTTAVADAEDLPFEDGSFDLVLGHAVLHHIPDLDRAFSEMRRVLAPGGTVLFAGEPSRLGDRISAVPKRTAWKLSPLWRRLVGARPGHGFGVDEDADGGAAADRGRPGEPDGEALEPFVDVHAFTPADLRRHAEAGGLVDVRIIGEELLANWFGWANRTLEASARAEDLPRWWLQYAFRGYVLLQKVDRALLEGRLPPAVFYNLMLVARSPS